MAIVLGLAGSGYLVAYGWLALAFDSIDPVARLRLNVLFLLAPLAASLAMARNAARFHGRARLAWGLIAASVGAWFVGQAAWAYQDLHHGTVLRPSLPDLAFSLTIPLAIAGVVMLWRTGPLRWLGIRAVLEGVVIGLSLFVVLWIFVLGPLRPPSWLFYAYTIGPVIILTGALLVLPRVSHMPVPRRLLLGAAILLIAAGNSASLVLNARDLYHIGHPIDLLWLSGFLLLAGFGWVRDPPLQRPARAARDLPAPSLFTYALVAAAIACASYEVWRRGSLDATIFLAGCLLLSALIALQRLAQMDARDLARQVERQSEELQRSNHELLRERARLDRAQAIAGLLEWEWRADSETPAATLGDWKRFGLSHGLHASEVDPEGWQRLRLAVADLRQGLRQDLDVQLRIVAAGRAPRWIRLWSEPSSEDGVVRGLAQDITVLKEVERVRWDAVTRETEVRRLRDIDRMRTTFINIAAHELNTPLTPLKLQLGVLKRNVLPSATPETQRSFDVLDRSVQRLADLVRDLLDAGRLQAGRMKFRFEPIDLLHVVREGVESYQAAGQHAGVAVRLEAPEEAIPVRADRHRLHEVLDNLLSNALKFTPPGGRVEVRIEAQAEDVRVDVRDSGIGIDEDGLKALFQPFCQVGGPIRQGDSGSGLGLYIAQGIAKAHGGDLVAQSEGLGRGSTFRLSLPRASALPLAAPPLPQAVRP